MDFSFKTLWLPAACTAVFGAWVLARFVKLSWPAALAVSSSKAAIPFLYFLNYFQPGWLLLDDMSYYVGGIRLFYKGNNPFLMLFTPDGPTRLFALGGGQHILYYWYNLLAVYLFGPIYSSPVFLNVASTFIAGAILYKLVLASDFEERYARWLTILFLLHWDLLSWSSFVNLKDTLILTLTIAAIYAGQELVHTRKLRYGLLLAFAMCCFWYIRFYIPVLVTVAFALWFVLTIRGWASLLGVSLALLGFYLSLPSNYSEGAERIGGGDVWHGLLYMFLSPRPWAVSPEYSFIMPASVLHWILFGPAVMGAINLYTKSRKFRLSAALYLVTIFFFALLPVSQTPRHRLHVLWVLAWAQFDFFWHLGSRKAFWGERISATAAHGRALLGAKT